MFGKLFKKDAPPAEGGQAKVEKPKEISPAVGRELVVAYKEDPDWVWKLKQVQRPSERGQGIKDFRVYDPIMAAGRGVAVRDYASLDQHPELVLYHGWLNPKNNEVQAQSGTGQQQQAS